MFGQSLRKVRPFVTNVPSCRDWARHHLTPTPIECNQSLPTGKNPPRQAKKYASNTISADAHLVTSVSSPTPAGSLAFMESTWAEAVPNSDLKRGCTPLRNSQFGRELAHHPDKAWVSWLLQSIDNRVSLGYTGPRGPSTARNLLSAHLHLEVITAELHKECAAGHIINLTSVPPLTKLKCSGVGVVPKKTGK